MIEGVDTHPLGMTDAGADRETRVHRCQLRTWCVREHGHGGSCAEHPRVAIAAADFGPGRAVRR